MTVQCDQLNLQGYMGGKQVVDLTVPAYIRKEDSFKRMVFGVMAGYIMASEEYGSGLSIADFALQLLAFASTEPSVQDKEG